MTKAVSPFKKAKRPKPQKIEVTPSSLVHTGTFSPGSQLPLIIEPAVQDLDAAQWLADQKTEIEALLRKHAAILFRGFQVRGPLEFEAFASNLCPDLYGDYGDLPHAEGKVYEVTPYPNDGTILFHNESSHMHRWPTRQFFFCQVPAKVGGTTPIVDCRTIYNKLRPEIRETLEEKQLRYVRNFIEGVDVPWQSFFKTESKEAVESYCRENGLGCEWRDGNLRTYQIAPAVVTHPETKEKVFFNQIQLHHIAMLDPEVREAMLKMFPAEDFPRNVYLGDGTPIDDTWVDEMLQLYWDNCSEFYWQSGDVLLVDNILVSHARKPYTPPREMFVAMGRIMTLKQLQAATG